jgi:hypothetical protein
MWEIFDARAEQESARFYSNESKEAEPRWPVSSSQLIDKQCAYLSQQLSYSGEVEEEGKGDKPCGAAARRHVVCICIHPSGGPSSKSLWLL